MDINRISNSFIYLKEWKLDGRVKERMKDSGFDGILRLTNFPMHQNFPLLSALVDCYDIEDRCFVFNNHKLVLGLEDILYITGLPKDGNAVTGVRSDGNELCMKYLGRNGCVKDKTGLTTLTWLRENFQKVPAEIENQSPQIEPYVRAFILYLIGSVVVPKTSGRVPLMYLSLMENLQSIKDYAWGAASLAHLHRSLENCKLTESTRVTGDTRHHCRILQGSAYFLLVFAMERVPKLMLEFCFARVNQVFPLLAEWTQLLCKLSKKPRVETRQTYLEILGELKEDDIVWQPYKRLPHDFLPGYCAGQEKISMSRTVLFCFREAVYHRPDLSPKQFGITKVNSNMLRPLIKLTVYASSSKRVNWATYKRYGCYMDEWENRASCVITESVGDTVGSPQFQAPSTSQSRSPNDPDLQSYKRKRVENLGNNFKLKRAKNLANLVDAASGSTNSSEPQQVELTNESTMKAADSSPAVVLVSSIVEEPATNHPSICPIMTTNPSDFALLPNDGQSSSKGPSAFDCNDLNDLFSDLNDLLHPTNAQASVNSAKHVIRGILCQGFDALTHSEKKEAFISSTEVLLAAGVFASDTDLKTRLKAFTKELQPNTSTFLQAEADIHVASGFYSLQEFLKEQAAKLPTLQERLHVADEKIAHHQAMLDAALEERAKMNEDVAAFVEKTKTAKQKLASLNFHAADIESKNLAAKEFVRKCHSSWGDLKTSLFRLL